MLRTKELKIYIESEEEFMKNLEKELEDIDEGRAETFKEDSISFYSLDQLRGFLTPKRIELLKAIKKQNPESIYSLAKLVKRTPENVNTDIKLLKMLGFVDTRKVKDKRNKVVPSVNYDRITFELTL